MVMDLRRSVYVMLSSFFFGVALGCCFILCSIICCICSQDWNHSLLTISTCVFISTS